MKRPNTPRLWYLHRNFFIAFFYVATFLHLGLAVLSFTNPERFEAKSLDLVYVVGPKWAWALLHGLAWLLMIIGAYHRFDRYARLGLALGMALCLSRGMLIELSAYPPGAGILAWGGFAVWQFTMLSEPQMNPLTARTWTLKD